MNRRETNEFAASLPRHDVMPAIGAFADADADAGAAITRAMGPQLDGAASYPQLRAGGRVSSNDAPRPNLRLAWSTAAFCSTINRGFPALRFEGISASRWFRSHV